jgi:hypothetical protein
MIAQADAWMRGKNIAVPAKLADVMAPGFSTIRSADRGA